VVTGNASDLYLMLWNRRDTTGLELDGEPDLLDLWRETVQLNSDLSDDPIARPHRSQPGASANTEYGRHCPVTNVTPFL